MAYAKLLFSFFLFNIFLFVDYASASEMEQIIGGYPALQSDFKYQAAILGKYNFTNVYNLLGGAGIIKNHFLISAARCFMYKHNQLKKIRFSAVVGADILMRSNMITKEIKKIYTYYYSNYHDIAIIRLQESLDLENRADLIPLQISDVQENFYGQIGIVAGFGINSINELGNKHREMIRVTGNNTRLMKYANVTIVNRRISQLQNDIHLNETYRVCDESVEDFSDICGIIQPDEMYDHRGVCMGDNGSPLVLGTKIIGIVSRHRKDCDDTVHGTIYNKVSKYRNFIESIIAENPINGTGIFNNPIHTPHW